MTVRRTCSLAGLTAAGLLAAVALVAPTAATAVPTTPGGAAEQAAPATPSRWIVRLGADAGDATGRALAAPGVHVIAAQEHLGTVVITADAATAARLRSVPGIAGVVADGTVKAASLGFDPATQPGALTNVNRVIGATDAWKKGYTGNGIDVALVDTGVSPVPALKDAAKIVIGPDLSFEDQNPDLRYLDTYGHGTHMAGIITGREVAKGSGSGYAADTQNFYGVAPDSRLVSLKLADQQGVVDVSQMIAAIDWVVANKAANGLNIKVLNISFGTESPQSPQNDPLSWAAEVAWKSGIVVVAAAGNDGGSVAGLSNPAYNPWVLAVGSADTKGTDAKTDDAVPTFSAKQGGNWGSRSVDVIAPGVGIVAPADPGSVLYDSYPSARVGSGFFRGSGTSQSAAVVSGAVALMLQARSWLSPDQVKAVLMGTADKLPGVAATAQGSGEIDLVEAVTANVPGTLQNPVNGMGTGSLESARGDFHVVIGGATLSGELDVMGYQWGSEAASRTANKTIWSSDGKFNGNPWMVGGGFTTDTTSWAGRTWSGRTWSGRTWSGSTWNGRTWSGRTWSGRTWSGSTWAGASWSDPVSSASWASSLWSGSSWK
ncbi:MAG: S8 family serine peptidase [Kineosporiaceae bacterium]